MNSVLQDRIYYKKIKETIPESCPLIDEIIDILELNEDTSTGATSWRKINDLLEQVRDINRELRAKLVDTMKELEEQRFHY